VPQRFGSVDVAWELTLAETLPLQARAVVIWQAERRQRRSATHVHTPARPTCLPQGAGRACPPPPTLSLIPPKPFAATELVPDSVAAKHLRVPRVLQDGGTVACEAARAGGALFVSLDYGHGEAPRGEVKLTPKGTAIFVTLLSNTGAMSPGSLHPVVLRIWPQQFDGSEVLHAQLNVTINVYASPDPDEPVRKLSRMQVGGWVGGWGGGACMRRGVASTWRAMRALAHMAAPHLEVYHRV
jgi:hypothetical protein